MKYTQGFGVLSGLAPGGKRGSVAGQHEGLLDASTFPICPDPCVSSFCCRLRYIGECRVQK